MGLIENVLGLVFGNGRNAIVETAQVFRENAESGAAREAELAGHALTQFGKEFGLAQRGLFDRVMDAINRLPRPALALGTMGMFTAAMVDPVWFSERMQGIALVPEPLWWLLGVIVSFYFGARHQHKCQEFQGAIAQTLALTPQVTRNIESLRNIGPDTPGQADTGSDTTLALALPERETGANPALTDWREGRQR